MNAFDRNTNLEIIRQLRNSEKISMDEYISKVLIPLKDMNPTFLRTLYKDICYILKGLDKETDNDLLIENGSIKLTGYQTRLHDITIWLHSELVLEILKITDNPKDLVRELNQVEQEFLEKQNYTPEYRTELDKIRRSMRIERKNNYENGSSWLKKYLDPNVLELKPNFFGLGLNINEIINRRRKR